MCIKAATGGVIDPRTTQRHSAIEAFQLGLLLEYQIDTIRRAELRANNRTSYPKLSVNEKVQLSASSSAICTDFGTHSVLSHGKRFYFLIADISILTSALYSADCTSQ